VTNSPIQEFDQQAQAEMQDYFGAEIVSTYGRLPLEYAAAFRSAAVMDRRFRAVIEVGGEDRLGFLNSLLTAELVKRDGSPTLLSGQWRFAFLLDRKGRLVAEMNVLETRERCLLDLDARLAEVVIKELERYHFRERVTIRVAAVLWQMAVYGPAAAKALAEAGVTEAGALRSGQCAMAAGVVVWRDDLGDSPGYGLLVDVTEGKKMWEKLISGPTKAMPIGWAAYNAVRIEAGRVLFGIDYDNTFLPAETGQLERGVSFTKGCYPGQEIVARMQARDQRARQVVRLRMGQELPLAGAKVMDEIGNEVGVVTSSTICPRLSGRVLAMACVKKGANEVGTRLKVPAEGAMREAVVEDAGSV